ncbi:MULTISPECIES: hypothetical protein [unclassified Clostridium]|uniref:hypothetical protein n=1 Tax=unclassified Clostridium TaxID=2614128 RepID=UPI0032167505
MGKYLNGSAKTGEKIIKNWDLFRYEFESLDENENKIFYKFYWNFDEQHGYIYITYNIKTKEISNSSLINTNLSSKYKFNRPLGLYNDNSLYEVFVKILQSQGKEVKGIFAN